MSKSDKILLDKSLVVKLVQMVDASSAEKRDVLSMCMDILEKMQKGPAVAMLFLETPTASEHMIFDSLEKAHARGAQILKTMGVNLEYVSVNKHNDVASTYKWDDDTHTMFIAMVDVE